jgi:hypothetical protein
LRLPVVLVESELTPVYSSGRFLVLLLVMRATVGWWWE